jgi:hypothetical protein
MMPRFRARGKGEDDMRQPQTLKQARLGEQGVSKG